MTEPLRVVVLMPVWNDWPAATELIRRIDKTVSPTTCTIEVIMVDDASRDRCSPHAMQGGLSVRAIRALRLRRNLGHQRAIAIGLSHVYQTAACDAVVVMDADGEDTPEGLVQLLRAYTDAHGANAVFAERSRRSESIVFRVFYQLYKFLHRLLAGIRVRVGNFSIMPFAYLDTLVVMSELWNHYAAAVFRSRLPFTMIPIPRGTRIAGTSRTNFVALVTHGLSAISVFGDVVGVRLLIGALCGSLLAAVGMVSIAMLRMLTDHAIPGWAPAAIGTLAIVAIQLITVAASFTFFVLSTRTNAGFLPIRDYAWFVEAVVNVYSHE